MPELLSLKEVFATSMIVICFSETLIQGQFSATFWVQLIFKLYYVLFHIN